MQGIAATQEVGTTKTLRMTLGAIGVFFILAGLYGFFDPSFFGLFSLMAGHNWVHLLTGILYTYLGFAPATHNVVAWTARIGGLVYFALGLIGFAMPNILDPIMVLGTNENIFHLLVGGAIAVIGFMIPTGEGVARHRGQRTRAP